MSWLKIAGWVLVISGILVHIYVAFRVPDYRWFIIAGAVLEAAGVSIRARSRR
jgi:hypothetical protein